jgi:hypothetical protein
MKVQKMDSGVYRFEPEESDVPVWEQSQEQLLRRGWSARLLKLVQRYLRPVAEDDSQRHKEGGEAGR